MHPILDSMFGSIFVWFLLPTWIPWTQFGTSGLAPNAFFRVFWEVVIWSYFGANLAPFWDPSWDPSAAQDGPKTPPRFFFKLSKTPPGQLKSHKSIQDRNLVHFWSQNPMGYPPGPRFSRFLARLNSNFAGLCESRCLFRAALYTSPPNTQSPANFHPLHILVQINPQSTWGPNKLARRYKGEAFYKILRYILSIS